MDYKIKTEAYLRKVIIENGLDETYEIDRYCG